MIFHLSGPQRQRLFVFIAFKLFGHPEERTKDGGAVVAGHVHDACLDDGATEFDEVVSELAAFDLPRPHVILRLMSVARRPASPERHHDRGRGQTTMQIALLVPERKRPRLPLSGVRGLRQHDQRAGPFIGGEAVRPSGDDQFPELLHLPVLQDKRTVRLSDFPSCALQIRRYHRKNVDKTSRPRHQIHLIFSGAAQSLRIQGTRERSR